MCHSGPQWKREVVQDHKFDFIDTRDYHSKSLAIRLQYLWVYILVIKSFLVYISDIYTATTMLTSETWSNEIFNLCEDLSKQGKTCIPIPFAVGKWLFVGCIIFSFLLVAYEAHKAKKIIASRDISFAFTNVMAQNYYSLRSYDHFCFFCNINDSTKKKDDFAFFIFFTFKGWKRLLLADGPRQTINALNLYSFYLSRRDEENFDWWEVKQYFATGDGTLVTNILLVAIVFTVLVFVGSLLLLIAAAILYVPLLCYIQGNLKEYCCHKIDKRISELLKRKHKQRVDKVKQLAKKEAAGDFSHRTDKSGRVHAAPQPTLPQISLDDDDATTMAGGSKYAGSIRTGKESYWATEYKDDGYGTGPEYPPMPAWDPQAYPPQPGYVAYQPSLTDHDGSGYDQNQYNTGHGNNNEQYGRSQYQDRFTPDPYGADPYGRGNTATPALQTQADAAYGYNQPVQGYAAQQGAYGQPDPYANQYVQQDGYGTQHGQGYYSQTDYNSNGAGYGNAPPYQNQGGQYIERMPSRNMLSRSENHNWGNQGGQNGHYQGGHAM